MADRQPVGGPDSAARDDAQVAERGTRAAATSFLRWRPVIVAPVAAANLALFVASGADSSDAKRLGAGLAVMTSAFTLESLALRRREVTTRWLSLSLLATTLGLAVGMYITGGVGSPILPLLFAPTVTAFAAFGQGHGSVYPLAASVIVLVHMATFPPGTAVPAAPWAARMLVVSMVGSLALLTLSVTGVFSAFSRTARALEGMRRHALQEARHRTETIEMVGAKVGHELKNPLAAIKGLIQLMAKQPQSERDQTRFSVIEGEIDRIEATLRSYLSFTRPMTDIKLEYVDLSRLLDEIAVSMEGRAAGAGVRVMRQGNVPGMPADPRRLREALLNLASNAIEASPAGGTVFIIGEMAPSGGARLIVADEGPGLSAPPRPFHSEKPGGSGLGLLITRNAAELHGGTLQIEQPSGGGTRAVIDLPPPAEPEEEEDDT